MPPPPSWPLPHGTPARMFYSFQPPDLVLSGEDPKGSAVRKTRAPQLGLGDVVVGLGVGDGLTDAAAATTGKNATVSATRKPTMPTRRMHATRHPLAADDLGCRNLVLEILASKVTVASAPSFGAANIR